MTKTIGAAEAKARLSELFDRVLLGERITITRRGEPVAMLVPLDERPLTSPEEAAVSLRRLRAGVKLDGISLRELTDEGRP